MKERELSRLLTHADAALPDCSARAFDADSLAAAARSTLREHRRATRRNLIGTACLLLAVATSAIIVNRSRPIVATNHSTQVAVTNLLRAQAEALDREAKDGLAFVRAVSTRQRAAAARTTTTRSDAVFEMAAGREQAAAVALKSAQRDSHYRQIVDLFPETEAARRAADRLKPSKNSDL